MILLNLFDIFVKENQKSSSIISFVSLPIIISMLSLFVCMVQVLLESLEKIKLNDIVDWISHALSVSISSVKSFKYGSTLSR